MARLMLRDEKTMKIVSNFRVTGGTTSPYCVQEPGPVGEKSDMIGYGLPENVPMEEESALQVQACA